MKKEEREEFNKKGIGKKIDEQKRQIQQNLEKKVERLRKEFKELEELKKKEEEKQAEENIKKIKLIPDGYGSDVSSKNIRMDSMVETRFRIMVNENIVPLVVLIGSKDMLEKEDDYVEGKISRVSISSLNYIKGKVELTSNEVYTFGFDNESSLSKNDYWGLVKAIIEEWPDIIKWYTKVITDCLEGKGTFIVKK